MKTIIVIPTYDEAENIERLISQIYTLQPKFNIIIVDDNSPDGTGAIVENLSLKNPRIHVIHRQQKSGLGTAYVEGFKKALELKADLIFEMDADLSHHPKYLQEFIDATSDFDLVIGSRYLGGVRIEGWPFKRLLLSKIANIFVSRIMVKPVWDFTSGYRCYRKEVLQSFNLNKIKSDGYAFQIEMTYLAFKHGFSVGEIPILFKERINGYSKISRNIVWEAFCLTLKFHGPIFKIFKYFSYFLKNSSDYFRLIIKKNKMNFEISIGIMAYNEESNIARLLDSILDQHFTHCQLKEIFIVASGCTDKTEDIARTYIQKDKRIKLLVQSEREGKASAINLFLSKATCEIIVLESGDTVPDINTLNKLIIPFEDPLVGMTGARPIPINQKKTFIDYTVNLLWLLHHIIAQKTPKLGELIAFRNIVREIPKDTAVDEASIEAIIRENSFDLRYIPDAVVFNKGPDNIKDFITQRRRITAGHKHLEQTRNYQVSTQNPLKIIKILLKHHTWKLKDTFWTLGAIALEVIGRLLGYYDFYIRKKNPFIWDIASSTKKWG